MKNKVYFVGAGPGDPALITLKGREILRQADVVIYDYLVDKRILAEAKQGAELICCDKLGKNRYSDGFVIHQERINDLIVKKVRQGKKVLRLKNGDPSIFSRLSQELEVLTKHNIEFEVVPGVTAASAASCFSGIPLTDRRFASSVVFVTGHQDPTKKERSLDWDSLSKSGTIVLYMAVENLAKIVNALLKVGKSPDTKVAIIQDASLLTHRIIIGYLKNIIVKAKREKVKSPAIIIIGEVVKLEKKLNWFRRAKKALFTGISPERFFSEKKLIFHLPLIKIEPLKSYKAFDRLIKDIGIFDWIVFSSRYGVQYFFQRLNKVGYDARRLRDIKIAAIGNSTAARLLDFGILADLVPHRESSHGLLEEFKKIDIKSKRIFLPRSDISDKGLAQGLKLQGADVTSGVAYKNVMPKYLLDLDFNFFDEIIFTSPSTVRNFKKRYKALPKKIKVSCIGEVTRREVKQWNLLDYEDYVDLRK